MSELPKTCQAIFGNGACNELENSKVHQCPTPFAHIHHTPILCHSFVEKPRESSWIDTAIEKQKRDMAGMPRHFLDAYAGTAPLCEAVFDKAGGGQPCEQGEHDKPHRPETVCEDHGRKCIVAHDFISSSSSGTKAPTLTPALRGLITEWQAEFEKWNEPLEQGRIADTDLQSEAFGRAMVYLNCAKALEDVIRGCEAPKGGCTVGDDCRFCYGCTLGDDCDICHGKPLCTFPGCGKPEDALLNTRENLRIHGDCLGGECACGNLQRDLYCHPFQTGKEDNNGLVSTLIPGVDGPPYTPLCNATVKGAYGLRICGRPEESSIHNHSTCVCLNLGCVEGFRMCHPFEHSINS